MNTILPAILLVCTLHVVVASPGRLRAHLSGATWREVKDAAVLPDYSAEPNYFSAELDDTSALRKSPEKRRQKWSSLFCKITCGTCKNRLNIGVAALCESECQRGVGDSYMACLVTMTPKLSNYII